MSYKWSEGSHLPNEGRGGSEERGESGNDNTMVERGRVKKMKKESSTVKDEATKAKWRWTVKRKERFSWKELRAGGKIP